MFSSKLNKFILVVAIALTASLTFIAPAMAATQTFQWQGAKGYLVRGKFEYDERSQFISQTGTGETEGLQSLTISFYDPTHKLIHTYNNVTDGIAHGNYFELHFDPTTQKLIGNIDLGGEVAGDTYLKGTVDRELVLIEVEPSGKEQVIDRDFSPAKSPKRSD